MRPRSLDRKISHVRRKFFGFRAWRPLTIALELLERISALYKAEADIRGQSDPTGRDYSLSTDAVPMVKRSISMGTHHRSEARLRNVGVQIVNIADTASPIYTAMR